MATVYFADTSALSKRYVAETGTTWLRTTLDPVTGCTIYIARITTVEIIAALTRRARGGSIALHDAAAARAVFLTHLGTEYNVIEATEPLVNHAMKLAEIHGLRGYDAVQLACALKVNVSYQAAGLPTIILLSADTELNVAAAAEGLDPLNQKI